MSVKVCSCLDKDVTTNGRRRTDTAMTDSQTTKRSQRPASSASRSNNSKQTELYSTIFLNLSLSFILAHSVTTM